MPHTEPLDLSQYLTTAQAAALANLTQHQIAHLCRTGTVQCVKVAPRLWLVEAKSLDEYLKTNPKPGPKTNTKPAK